MPQFRHGKNTTVHFDVTDFSPFLNTATYTAQVDVAETSAFGSTGKTYVTGLDGGTVSLGGMFSGIAGDIEPVLVAALASATDNNLTVGYDGGSTAATNGAGRRCGVATVQQTNLTITAPIGGMVSLQCDAQADGGVDYGRFLWTPNSTAITGTGPIFYTTGEDLGTTQHLGATANLHVMANTLNQTMTIKMQHSATGGGAYADFGTPMTFASVGAGTTNTQNVVSTYTGILQFVRAHITLGGVATGAATVIVSFAKR